MQIVKVPKTRCFLCIKVLFVEFVHFVHSSETFKMKSALFVCLVFVFVVGVEGYRRRRADEDDSNNIEIRAQVLPFRKPYDPTHGDDEGSDR